MQKDAASEEGGDQVSANTDSPAEPHTTLPIAISQNGLAALQVYHGEITTYLRELPALIEAGHAWEYVLIHGSKIVGIWVDQADAIKVGREHFGLDPIFVKKIDPRDPELYAALKSRLGSSCPF